MPSAGRPWRRRGHGCRQPTSTSRSSCPAGKQPPPQRRRGKFVPMSTPAGMVAAGHPLTAEAGARVLREGGNAVDAAIGAMLTSWVAEPLYSGPGAGGYLLVAGAGEEPTLLDFFVSSPGRGADDLQPAELLPVVVSFGDADQIFNVGPASCGAYGNPAGIAAAHERWGTIPLSDLAAPAAQLARDGVTMNARQSYVFEI